MKQIAIHKHASNMFGSFIVFYKTMELACQKYKRLYLTTHLSRVTSACRAAIQFTPPPPPPESPGIDILYIGTYNTRAQIRLTPTQHLASHYTYIAFDISTSKMFSFSSELKSVVAKYICTAKSVYKTLMVVSFMLNRLERIT